MPVFYQPLLFALMLWLPLNVSANPSFIERHAVQREIFIELDLLLRDGEIQTVKNRRTELDGYPLQDYLDFRILSKEIAAHAEPADLLGRVNKLQDQKRMHRRLIGSIKNRSVALGRWQDYKVVAALDNAPVHPCDDLLAGLKTGKPFIFSKPVAELWAEPARHTQNCHKAFDMLLEQAPDIPVAALWSRVVSLVKRGDADPVGKLLKYFNRRDQRVISGWIAALDEPQKLLTSDKLHGNSAYHAQVAEFLLKRWARKDLLSATEFWADNAHRFGHNNKSVQKTLARYAVLAAKRGMPESADLLSQVESERDVRYWRVRLALLNRDWEQCVARLDELTDKEQSQIRWQYWRARCLESQGFMSAANRIYEKAAKHFEYYGFMAADRLSKTYPITTRQPLINEAEIEAIRKSPEIARAIEFFLIDVPWEGRIAWNAAVKPFSKDRYLAAASVAESVGWHDRALKAVVAAGEDDALDTLFPTPHRSYVQKTAKRFSVQREYVYGVMRQESRFMSDIRSSAGAVGLMQLMPATAKQMGKKLGVSAPKWKLIDSELNIQLGVSYLNHVLKRFDNNLVLATAAYNAGPTRVSKWLVDQPMAADVWVEAIPFDETRTYVKAVLFNTVVSEWILNDGIATRLQERMPELLPELLVAQ